MANPQDPYVSVPRVAPTTEAPRDYLGVRSSPNQFGSQKAEAIQRVGAALGQTGDKITQYAVQQQGMINETVATDAETAYAAASGKLLGEYKSLQGLTAVNALPKTVQALQELRTKIGSALPNPAVQRSFHMMASRREAFALEDVNSYSATQVKKADLASANAARDLSIASASSSNVAGNQALFDEEVANIKFQTARSTADYDKNVYNAEVNEAIGKAWTNRISTLAFDPEFGSIETAVKTLTDNRDQIPPATYSALSSRLAPAYRNEKAREGADELVNEVDAEYTGAIQGGMKPEGMHSIVSGLLPGINITSGLRTPEDNARVNGVPNSKHLTGNAVDFTVPEDMTFDEVKKRLDEGGFKYKELKNYVNDPNHGDHVHLAWGSDKGTPVSEVAEGYISKANYYRMNYSSIIDKARQKAEQLYKDDSTFADNYVTRVEQRINNEIRQEDLKVKVNQDTVLNSIQGSRFSAPVVTLDQLDLNPDPKVRQALADWRANDAYADVKMNNLIRANTAGKALTYGNQFYKLYTDAVTGKINNPTDLLSYLSGPNQPLTNTGYEALKRIMNDRLTPEGSAWSDQTKKFLDGIERDMTSKIPGVKLEGLEANFQKSLMTLIPRIEAGRAAGLSPGQMFDPKSADYVGRDVKNPSQSEITAARAQAILDRRANPQTSDVNKVYKTIPDIITAFQTGKIDKATADRLLIEGKHARAPDSSSNDSTIKNMINQNTPAFLKPTLGK